MEKAVAQGKVRAIGLSNFESERLEEVCEAAAVKPAVLQVECHPYSPAQPLPRFARSGRHGPCRYGGIPASKPPDRRFLWPLPPVP